MAKQQFGISTHLYHNQRLCREHLLEIGAHGFERVELFATRTHFDFHNPAAVADLQQWLAEAGLVLHGVHAPIGESFAGGRWGPPLTLASTDRDTRAKAMHEAELALQIARRVPFGPLVAHIGLPRTQQPTAADNSRDAAARMHYARCSARAAVARDEFERRLRAAFGVGHGDVEGIHRQYDQFRIRHLFLPGQQLGARGFDLAHQLVKAALCWCERRRGAGRD